MYDAPAQAELFAAEEMHRTYPAVFRADPEKVRAQLLAMLAELRTAATMPWHGNDLRCNRTIFPQMTNWLPEEEATRLKAEFETALARLSA